MKATMRQFDIESLDAKFHLTSIFPAFFLKAPLGVTSFSFSVNKIIFSEIFNKNQSVSSLETIRKFEKVVCKKLNVRHCIGTANGRDAIKLSLLSMGLKKGDRVLLPDYCCLSVLLPVIELELTPVLIDVNSELQLDVKSLQRVIRTDDKALIVPHLFGGLADMDLIVDIARNHGVKVIDDAAQAIGLKHALGAAGTGGHCGVLSFGTLKPVGAMGGGAYITNDRELYARAIEVISDANIEEQGLSKTSIIKIYLKTVCRKMTYGLFLFYRYLQTLQEKSDQFIVSHNKKVKTISKFDALMTVSVLKKSIERKTKMKSAAHKFFLSIDRFPHLKNVMVNNEFVGYPRWPLKFTGTNKGSYPDFFRFMLKNGIEVQPAYIPLHKYIQSLGMQVDGEYRNSLEIYNQIICLPFASEKNNKRILMAIKKYSRVAI